MSDKISREAARQAIAYAYLFPVSDETRKEKLREIVENTIEFGIANAKAITDATIADSDAERVVTDEMVLLTTVAVHAMLREIGCDCEFSRKVARTALWAALERDGEAA